MAFRYVNKLMTETVANEYGITREQSDAFAIRSHALSNYACVEGLLDDEVFPVGNLTRDEGIRPGSDMEAMGALRAVFREGGQVTAGNSSQVSDGASAVLVASEEAAAELGLPVLARIVG